MKERIYYPLLAVLMVLFCTACNEEWTDEQYERYVSFKAPMNYAKGVTDIYVKYKSNGMVTYQLPLIMSGSTMAGTLHPVGQFAFFHFLLCHPEEGLRHLEKCQLGVFS